MVVRTDGLRQSFQVGQHHFPVVVLVDHLHGLAGEVGHFAQQLQQDAAVPELLWGRQLAPVGSAQPLE